MKKSTLVDYLKMVNPVHAYKSGKESIKNLMEDEKGQTGLMLLLGTAAMPVCAYLGSWAGQGLGWVGGQIVDFLPYVNRAAPWLADRVGKICQGMSRHELNIGFYQTAGAINGFWAGLWLPWNIIAKWYNYKKKISES